MIGLATPDKTQRVVVVPEHFDDVFPLSGPLCICGWNFLGPVKGPVKGLQGRLC